MQSLTRVAITAVAIAAMVALASGSVQAAPTPCNELDLSYSLRVVEPRQVFDYSQVVANCSNRARTIRVRIQAFGPCEFPHPVSAKYRLPAHFAVQTDALIVAPSCKRHYRIVGKAIVGGFVVDEARAGFTVVAR
jgi:hypothetical protein